MRAKTGRPQNARRQGPAEPTVVGNALCGVPLINHRRERNAAEGVPYRAALRAQQQTQSVRFGDEKKNGDRRARRDFNVGRFTSGVERFALAKRSARSGTGRSSDSRTSVVAGLLALWSQSATGRAMAKEDVDLKRSHTAAGPSRNRTGFPVCRATTSCALGHQHYMGRYASGARDDCQMFAKPREKRT